LDPVTASILIHNLFGMSLRNDIQRPLFG
jgi:hypothetical protein